ncbi:histidinol-phosphate transaminase [Ferrimonas gelatinilytica]|uniref:Histidinol-phosphate aminotransferase n=1 Tax=Ferrimonas gelatinilytica TaxID=1255257 RepID=A0ABP9RX24_9GAMM
MNGVEQQAQKLAQRLVRPEIAALTPYASARREHSGGRLWLNANESPWNNTNIDGVNRYPDCQPEGVRTAYAVYADVRPEQLLISRGADEGIDLLIRAFCRPGQDCIATFAPSYGMYAISAATNGVACKTLEWGPGYTLPEDTASRVNDCKLLFLCNPNNPSGTTLAPEAIITLAKALPHSLLVVDEAYIEFCPELSLVPALAQCPNLVVLRTLSKAFALAGARCGFTLANSAIIEMLLKVIAPYPVPAPVAQLAVAALAPEGIARMQAQVQSLNTSRDALSLRLSSLPGVRRVLPSSANFLLFELEDAKGCYQQLVQQGLLIRAYRDPALDAWLRISIGSDRELAQLEHALGAILQGSEDQRTLEQDNNRISANRLAKERPQ